jgi:hypothetical protein
MKKRWLLHISMVVLMTFTIAAEAIAEPDQGLMICVKKDPAGNYVDTNLDGPWYFGALGLENYETGDPEGHTWWGTNTYNSSGTPWTMTVNGMDYDSSISGTTPYTGHYTYAVDSEGVVDFPASDTPTSTSRPLGYLSANRQYFVGAHGTLWTDPDPDDIQFRMDMAIKQSAGKTNASLNGTYHIRDLEFYNISDASRSASVVWGTITFSDPDYALEFYSYDSDGTESAQKIDSGTYAVHDDGSIVFSQPNEPDLYGQLSPDDNVLFISMGRTSSHGPQNALKVGIKATSGYSNADLSGDYHLAFLVVHQMEDLSRDGELIWGTMHFDGNGVVTNFSLDEFWSDGDTGASTGSGTYMVNNCGTVIIALDTINGQPADPAPEFEGHLSSDGELMALTFTDLGAHNIGGSSDIDGDGDIDESDLAEMAAQIGRIDCTYATPCSADMDLDCDVDAFDLKLFADNFGQPAP